MPIETVGISGGINPRITYNRSFEEIEACVAANLSPWTWSIGGYPAWFRARILAWHRLRALISSHIEDAKAKEMKKHSKK